jgi:hypothetical protein
MGDSREKTYIRTGQTAFDNLIPQIKAFLEQDSLDVVIDGKSIRGYRSPDAKSLWIRDFSDILRGVKYFEKDLKSMVEHFAETQAANGRIFDYFTTFPEKLPCERENWTKYVRVPVEADVEYRFIKAAYIAWQATGDDPWIQDLLPHMERALQYVLSHPWRWDEDTGLVKRAYTIDTWDFAYTAGKHEWLQFQITDDTYWGIMHGDNSGYYQAFILLARMYEYFKMEDNARIWRARADELRTNMNRICWNGTFYWHFVKLNPVDIPGVDESVQLSLSNPIDINRGVPTHLMAASILQEYIRRKKETESFAEWFSIDPPFPDGVFGDEKFKGGAYVNGGILPLVGGELARAAFEHGFEDYGVDILLQYAQLISESNATYLWYFPDGRPCTAEASTSPEASSTDGWGSSAMLYALIEGLAGIEDNQKLFRKCRISPRWFAADISDAEVRVCYESSGAEISYSIGYEAEQIHLGVQAIDADCKFHILLPGKLLAKTAVVNGQNVAFTNQKIRKTNYVDIEHRIDGKVSLVIHLEE